jgi:hypothetical protein
MLAEVGVMVTEVAAGVEGVDGVEGLLLEALVPLQPLQNATPSRTSNFVVRRMVGTDPQS